MPPSGEFIYDFSLPLSKYNTLRYEDKTRQRWQDEGIGEFVRNDRFYCKKKPKTVKVTIRKTYEIPLDWAGFFCAFFTKTFSPKIKWDFCINCLLITRRKCGIMAGRSQVSRPEFPIGSTYAKFLFNLAHFHMASHFPETWLPRPILFLSHHWLIFPISFDTQPTSISCS